MKLDGTGWTEKKFFADLAVTDEAHLINY